MCAGGDQTGLHRLVHALPAAPSALFLPTLLWAKWRIHLLAALAQHDAYQ